MKIKSFLSNSVFYPCSGLDAVPVRFLHKRFQNFFYADIGVDREIFEQTCRSNGFRGYDCSLIETIDERQLLGSCGLQSCDPRIEDFSKTVLDPNDCFVAKADFERRNEFDDEHGPEGFCLLFARIDGVMAYELTYNRLGTKPKCVCYIRPGVDSMGGNYDEFPRLYQKAIRNNSAGLPQFVLFDHEFGCRQFVPLIKDYEPVERFDYQTEIWGGANVTLSKRK